LKNSHALKIVSRHTEDTEKGYRCQAKRTQTKCKKEYSSLSLDNPEVIAYLWAKEILLSN
jgi:hypothetical protein